MYSYINDQLLSETEKSISPCDRGLLLGDGVFTTLKAKNGNLIFFNEHMERIKRHANTIYINTDSITNNIFNKCKQLLTINQLNNSEAYIRITITRGISNRGINIPKTSSPTLIIRNSPVNHITRVMPKLCISDIVRNEYSPISRIKSLNYLEPILAKKHAEINGFDDGIMLNSQGFVTECSVSNIFFIKKDRIITPRLEDGILDGITRNKVINICKKLNISIEELSIKTENLKDVTQAFQTNSSFGVQPVHSINNHHFNYKNNEIIAKIIANYNIALDLNE